MYWFFLCQIPIWVAFPPVRRLKLTLPNGSPSETSRLIAALSFKCGQHAALKKIARQGKPLMLLTLEQLGQIRLRSFARWIASAVVRAMSLSRTLASLSFRALSEMPRIAAAAECR